MAGMQHWFEHGFGSPRRQFAAWQRRRFWARQAVGVAHHHDSGAGAIVCEGLEALEASDHATDLFSLHHDLDGLPTATIADQSRSLRLRLVRELYAPAAASLLGMPDGSLGGYAWARVAALAPTLRNVRLRPGLGAVSGADWKTVQDQCADLVGDEAVLGLYAIGLIPRWRHGFAPLKQLLRPLLELGARHAARHALWWVPAGSSLQGLSLGFGAGVVADVGAGRLFHHPDLPTLARVFSSLPASSIADGLARMAPARQPAAVVSRALPTSPLRPTAAPRAN